MSDHSCSPLSRDGEARREAMLEHLMGVVRKTQLQRRRRRRRCAVGGVVTALIAGVILLSSDAGRRERLAGPPEPSGDVEPVERHMRERLSPGCETVIVQTSTSVLAQYQVDAAKHTVWIDDGTLLATLAAIGRPAELIREDGRTRLSAPVTDDEIRDLSRIPSNH